MTTFVVGWKTSVELSCCCQIHTDQREPRTPDVLDTPDQVFHGRNGGGVSIFIFMDLINLDRNVDLQQCKAE